MGNIFGKRIPTIDYECVFTISGWPGDQKNLEGIFSGKKDAYFSKIQTVELCAFYSTEEEAINSFTSCGGVLLYLGYEMEIASQLFELGEFSELVVKAISLYQRINFDYPNYINNDRFNPNLCNQISLS